MGAPIVEADPWEVPGGRVGIGAHRCELAFLANLRARADGLDEQFHPARAGSAKDAVRTAVPAALSLNIISAERHRYFTSLG